MRSSPVSRAAAIGYAGLVVGAVVAPSLALDAATARGGASRSAGTDLVVASAAVGIPYAVFLHRRLARAVDAERTDLWLSAVHALVVLSLAAAALPAAALHASARLHARVADDEWPLLLSWTALLGLAVLLGEGTRRWSLRWLTAEIRQSGGRKGGGTPRRCKVTARSQPDAAGRSSGQAHEREE